MVNIVFKLFLRNTGNMSHSIRCLIYLCVFCRWKTKTSMVTPKEDIFYLVAFLSSAMPSSNGTDGLEYILGQNKRILEVCETANLETKQYLPHYTTQDDWKKHFGSQWEDFVRRKFTYDPLAILTPGQRIFKKAISNINTPKRNHNHLSF